MRAHLMFQNFSDNRAVYDITWKKYGTAGETTKVNIIRHTRFARWMPKARDIHSEYAFL
jgi:hypothetical protein